MEKYLLPYDKERKRLLAHDISIRTKFGINRTTYEAMLLEQNHKCFICGSEDNEGQLAVDHNHETDDVRGLLCRQCNRGLGMFHDNVDLLRKAIEYLSREYSVPHQPNVERIPQEERPRWRNIVHTPDGTFASFDEAGTFYNVHPTTIGGWCGKYKGKKREGFTSERIFCSLEDTKNGK